MSAVTTASVHIDGKLLTITGDTGCEHLVSEASEVLDKHFNVGSLDRNQAALPGPDTSGPALTSHDGCEVAELMEAQEGAALPARVMNSPALVAGAEDMEASAGGESVADAALASAETEQMEAAAGAKDAVVEEASTGGESVELPGLVLASVEAEDIEAAVGAEDTVTEDTETVSERSYACKQCGKTFDSWKKRANHTYKSHNHYLT